MASLLNRAFVTKLNILKRFVVFKSLLTPHQMLFFVCFSDQLTVPWSSRDPSKIFSCMLYSWNLHTCLWSFVFTKPLAVNSSLFARASLGRAWASPTLVKWLPLRCLYVFISQWNHTSKAEVCMYMGYIAHCACISLWCLIHSLSLVPRPSIMEIKRRGGKRVGQTKRERVWRITCTFHRQEEFKKCN